MNRLNSNAFENFNGFNNYRDINNYNKNNSALFILHYIFTAIYYKMSEYH